MNPQEQIDNLTKRIEDLENQLKNLGDYSTIPLKVENAFIARGFFKGNTPTTSGLVYVSGGVLKVLSGSGIPQLVSNVPGLIGGIDISNVFVANVSGGATTHKLDITGGVATSLS